MSSFHYSKQVSDALYSRCCYYCARTPPVAFICCCNMWYSFSVRVSSLTPSCQFLYCIQYICQSLLIGYLVLCVDLPLVFTFPKLPLLCPTRQWMTAYKYGRLVFFIPSSIRSSLTSKARRPFQSCQRSCPPAVEPLSCLSTCSPSPAEQFFPVSGLCLVPHTVHIFARCILPAHNFEYS